MQMECKKLRTCEKLASVFSEAGCYVCRQLMYCRTSEGRYFCVWSRNDVLNNTHTHTYRQWHTYVMSCLSSMTSRLLFFTVSTFSLNSAVPLHYSNVDENRSTTFDLLYTNTHEHTTVWGASHPHVCCDTSFTPGESYNTLLHCIDGMPLGKVPYYWYQRRFVMYTCLHN